MFLRLPYNRPFLIISYGQTNFTGSVTLPVSGYPTTQLLPLPLMFPLQLAKIPWYLKNANRSGKTQGCRKALKF